MPWESDYAPPIVAPAISDSAIRFLMSSDEHVTATGQGLINYGLYKAFIERCRNERPDYVIGCGDTGDSRIEHFKKICLSNMTCLRPHVFCVGNHDEEEYTLGLGHTSAAMMAEKNGLNYGPPFWKSYQLSSGDGTFKLRCIVLDTNFYNDTRSENHEIGDRVGISASTPSGDYYRMIGTTQAAWMAAELAADTTSQAVLFISHIFPNNALVIPDYWRIADVLKADGRPSMGLGGHLHSYCYGFAIKTQAAETISTLYCLPGMTIVGCSTRMRLSWVDNAISIDEMTILDYNESAGYNIQLPFTVGS